MSKTTESCQSCKFWKRLNAINGDCRRFPPAEIVRFYDGESRVTSEFPLSAEYEWCGEYVKGEAK